MTKEEVKTDVIFLASLVAFFYGLYRVGCLSTSNTQEKISMGIRG